MEAVIVTGADGFVGSRTVNYLLSKDIRVLAIDEKDEPVNLTPHRLLTYQKSVKGTISSEIVKEVMGQYDTWIHLAWEGSVGEERGEYGLQLKNIEMTIDCIKIAKKIGCTRFVNAGTILEKEVLLSIEQKASNLRLSGIYGACKMSANYIGKTIGNNIGIEFIEAVITNTYGIGDYSNGFLNATIKKMMSDEQLQFTSGVKYYDFVYISDVARAFYLIAKNGRNNQAYIIGTSHPKMLKEFVEAIHVALGGKGGLEFDAIKSEGVHLPLEAFDTKATEFDTGFKASVSFNEGIRKTAKWLSRQ